MNKNALEVAGWKNFGVETLEFFTNGHAKKVSNWLTGVFEDLWLRCSNFLHSPKVGIQDILVLLGSRLHGNDGGQRRAGTIHALTQEFPNREPYER